MFDGIIISEDTDKGQVDNPLSLNRYTYTWNNPLRYFDPTGNRPEQYSSASEANFEKIYNDVVAGRRSLEGLSEQTKIKIKQRIYAPAFEQGPELFVEGLLTGFTLGELAEVRSIVALTARRGGLKIGQEIGQLGKVVKHPQQTITELSKHALQRAEQRGLTQELMEQTVKNAKLVLEQPKTDTYFYMTKDAVVVLNKAGKVVTAYGKDYFDDVIKAIAEGLK